MTFRPSCLIDFSFPRLHDGVTSFGIGVPAQWYFVLVSCHPFAPYIRARVQSCIPSLQTQNPRHINKSHPFFPSPSRLLRSRPTFCIVLRGMASHTPTHIAGCRIVPPAYQPFEAATTSALIILQQRQRMPRISFLVTSRGDAGTAKCLFSFLYTQILVSSSELVLD
jgi:hypothetical protein